MEAAYLATLAARRPSYDGVELVSGVSWNFQHGAHAAITRSVLEEMPVGLMAGKRPAAVVIASCAAAYYPEANLLVPLAHFDPKSGTPSYKAVPVRVRGRRRSG